MNSRSNRGEPLCRKLFAIAHTTTVAIQSYCRGAIHHKVEVIIATLETILNYCFS